MQVPYRIVEVNPLTKKQLKWTTHKKVPVVLLDNDLQDDSSLILSRLAVEFEKVQPEPSKGWFSKSEKVLLSAPSHPLFSVIASNFSLLQF